MANNGSDSQNGASSTPETGSAGSPPQPTGPFNGQAGPGGGAPPSPPSSDFGSPSGGGSSSRPQGPPAFPLNPQRAPGAPRVEAGQKTLSPPFPTELSTPGQPLKVDVAPKAPAEMLRDVLLKTCQDTVSFVAAQMYPTDPRAAAEVAMNAMNDTIKQPGAAQSGQRLDSPLKSAFASVLHFNLFFDQIMIFFRSGFLKGSGDISRITLKVA